MYITACQDPSLPADGQVFADGQTATYSCNTGYTLDGQPVRACASDGTGWNGTDPFCSKKERSVLIYNASLTTVVAVAASVDRDQSAHKRCSLFLFLIYLYVVRFVENLIQMET